jgi:hypothetical protein
VKTLFGIVGALVGGGLGLVGAFALVELVSGGNTLAEGFTLLVVAPIGALTGIVVGALVAIRVVLRLRETPTSVVGRRDQTRLIVGLLLGIPAAFAVAILIAREAVKPPSDAAMLRHFERQQTTFDELVKMASTDKGLVRVDEGWTMPADPQSVRVSRDRLAAYRKLLRDAGTPRGFKVSQDDAGYDFYFWLRGSAISDDVQKGFAYRTTPPPDVVQTLDDIRAHTREYMVAYRHIRGNWYLIYEFVPD